MVLFKEDEARIKEMERQEKLAKRTPLGRWLRRLFKISIIASLMVLLSLSLLRGLSGNNAALKKGIEDYLSQGTGLTAKIGQFTYMEFFPELELDAGLLQFYAGSGDAPLATIGKAKFSAGFFDLMLSRQRIKVLQLENITLSPELAGGMRLDLAQIALVEDAGDDSPGLVASGRWGDSDLNAAFKMGLEKDGKEKTYTLPEKSDFTLRLGALSGEGYMTKAGPLGGLAFYFAALGTETDRVAGMIAMKKRLFGNSLVADLTFGESRFMVDGKLQEPGIKGAAGFPVLHGEDIAILRGIYEAAKAYIPTLPVNRLLDLYSWKTELDLSIGKFHGRDYEGRFNLPLTIEDQIVRAGPLSGTYSGGALDGSLMLDARALPAIFKTSGGLAGADYAMLGGTGGPLTLRWQAEGEGKTLKDLAGAVTGDLKILGGEGSVTAAALYDAIGAALPGDSGQSMAMQCLLGDLRLKDGALVPSPLLLDTAAEVKTGTGKVDLENWTSTLGLAATKDAGVIKVEDAAALAALDNAAAQACSEYLKTEQR